VEHSIFWALDKNSQIQINIAVSKAVRFKLAAPFKAQVNGIGLRPFGNFSSNSTMKRHSFV